MSVSRMLIGYVTRGQSHHYYAIFDSRFFDDDITRLLRWLGHHYAHHRRPARGRRHLLFRASFGLLP